jgi:hypothetical protein
MGYWKLQVVGIGIIVRAFMHFSSQKNLLSVSYVLGPRIVLTKKRKKETVSLFMDPSLVLRVGLKLTQIIAGFRLVTVSSALQERKIHKGMGNYMKERKPLMTSLSKELWDKIWRISKS